MRLPSYGAFLLASVLLFSASVIAPVGQASSRSSTALERSMGEIRWGWTPKQVYRHLKSQIEESYRKPIAKTTDAIEEDRLRHNMSEEARRIRDRETGGDR